MEQIESRRRVIRLSVEDLAKGAGCNPNTAGPALSKRRRPRYDIALALGRSLVAEELRLRDYLLSIHPVTTTDEGKAA